MEILRKMKAITRIDNKLEIGSKQQQRIKQGDYSCITSIIVIDGRTFDHSTHTNTWHRQEEQLPPQSSRPRVI